VLDQPADRMIVKIDDDVGSHTRPGRPASSHPELLTLAVEQVSLRAVEARRLRFVPRAFPYLFGRSGYHNRLRLALSLVKRLLRA